jgi:hypothetical protein
MTTRWTWHPVKPGDKYAITPWVDGEQLPYTVTQITIWDRVFYESWFLADNHHHRIGAADNAADARHACVNHHREQQQ